MRLRLFPAVICTVIALLGCGTTIEESKAQLRPYATNDPAVIEKRWGHHIGRLVGKAWWPEAQDRNGFKPFWIVPGAILAAAFYKDDPSVWYGNTYRFNPEKGTIDRYSHYDDLIESGTVQPDGSLKFPSGIQLTFRAPNQMVFTEYGGRERFRYFHVVEQDFRELLAEKWDILREERRDKERADREFRAALYGALSDAAESATQSARTGQSKLDAAIARAQRQGREQEAREQAQRNQQVASQQSPQPQAPVAQGDRQQRLARAHQERTQRPAANSAQVASATPTVQSGAVQQPEGCRLPVATRRWAEQGPSQEIASSRLDRHLKGACWQQGGIASRDESSCEMERRFRTDPVPGKPLQFTKTEIDPLWRCKVAYQCKLGERIACGSSAGKKE